MLLWAGLGLAGVFLSYSAGQHTGLIERCFFALALASPSLVLAFNGHFGVGEWQIPSVPAQVYMIWTLGLLPSMAAATGHALGQYHYQSEAKWVGSSAFLVWFLGFCLGAGRKRTDGFDLPSQSAYAPRWGTFDAIAAMLVLIAWASAGVVAMKASALSSWTNTAMTDLLGTGEGAGIIFYWALIPLIPILGILLWVQAPSRRRWLAWIHLIFGFLALVVYSNRRLLVYLAVLALYIVYQAGRRLPAKVLLVGLATGALLMGPLLWPIRVAIQNPELMHSQENPIQVAGEAVVRYATDPQFRALASSAGRENQEWGRFNYADTFLASVQWTLDHGMNGSPSFLFAPVSMIPSFIWPSKVDLAEKLNIKRQFNVFGISNAPDFQVSPILESFFQLGFAGVLLGGLFWGWMAKVVGRSFSRARERIEWMVLWIAFYLGVISFEAYFSAFLVGARESILIAFLLGTVRWIMGSRGQAMSEQMP